MITAGPTIEYIDPVRVITNQSTGKTGVLLAKEMQSAGARVTMVYGPGRETVPDGIKHIPVKTTAEMKNAIQRELKKKFDIVIMAAAASDYTVKNPSKSKIKSTKESISIKLVKSPKIINQIKKIQKDTFLVGFKAETNLSKNALEKEAIKKLQETGADMVIANDIGAEYSRNSENNQVLVVSSNGKVWSRRQKKEKIARFIRKQIEKEFQSK